MSYLDQSTACDGNDCKNCPGYVSVIDQDGNSRYTCKHSCHQRKREAKCKAEGHLVPEKVTMKCACCEGEIEFKATKPSRPSEKRRWPLAVGTRNRGY
jgi:hypothetical protein